MKVGSLCTGYGGLDLAIEAVTGGHTVWYSEFDKHIAKIMEHHRPDLLNLWDLTKVDWATVDPIDILTAGYPCQPFSAAGQRKGTNDPRHIWPSIAKAISILRPRLVVLENVRGHLSLGFNEVLATLAKIGYDARWELVRASDVGEPHQRARLFVVAYPQGTRWGTQQNRQRSSDSEARNGLGIIDFANPCITADSQSRGSRFQQLRNQSKIAELGDNVGAATDSYGNAHEEPRRTNSSISSEAGEVLDRPNWQIDWGRYQDAITRWEQLTRIAPHPITDNKLEPKFVEWMMGLPEGWVTNTTLNRNQQLKALGNGVVPQQATHALQLLLS